MKHPRINLIFILIVMFFLSSCTTTSQRVKKEASAKRDLGEAYLLQGKFTHALREFLKAEKMDPDDPQLHNDLGLVYMIKNKNDLAVLHFKKSIALKPAYSEAKNNLGTVYLRLKKWDLAIPLFKEIINDMLYETPHYPFANLGWAYYNKREYQLSEQHYLKALEIEPKFPKALLGLGRLYIPKKTLKAIEMLKKAISYSPDVPDLHFELARAYKLSQQFENALASFTKVTKLAPETVLGQRAGKEVEELKKKLR